MDWIEHHTPREGRLDALLYMPITQHWVVTNVARLYAASEP